MCGILRGPTQIWRTCHEVIADTIDGGIADFLTIAHDTQIERWAQFPAGGPQLPLGWTASDASCVSPAQEEKLRAYCKCGGIDFEINRPPEGSKYAELLSSITRTAQTMSKLQLDSSPPQRDHEQRIICSRAT